MKRGLAGVSLIATLSLCGCGGGSGSGASASPSGSPEPSATAAVVTSPTRTAASASARRIADRVKAAIPSATKVVTITEDNDPNNLIGRPNGYVSAAVIYDSTVKCDELGVDCGATVETWGSEADAKARSAYIQKLQKDSPILGSEYDTVNGVALLRVTGDIKPSLAAKYKAAFTEE